MNTLLELLKEYEATGRGNDESRIPLQRELIDNQGRLRVFGYPLYIAEMLLTSTRYGFICWLVNTKEYPVHWDRVKRYGIMHTRSTERYQEENFSELGQVVQITTQLIDSYSPTSELLYILGL